MTRPLARSAAPAVAGALVAGALAAVLGIGLAACGGRPASSAAATPTPPAGPPTVGQQFAAAADAVLESYLARHPATAVGLGRHEHDGKLPDVSEAGIAATVAWLEQSRTRIAAFAPGELDEVQRVERAALLATLEVDHLELAGRREPFKNPIYYLEALALDAYLARDYAPLADRARAVIRLAGGATAHLLAAQANLPGAMPRAWIDVALLQTEGSIAFAKQDVVAGFAGLADPALQGELTTALAAYVGALEGYRDLLTKAKKNGTQDHAIGEAAFLALVRAEGLAIELPALEALAAADLERNRAALDAAAKATKASTRRAVAKVLADRPKAEELLAVAGQQAAVARAFVADKRLVGIPTADVAEVRETPAFMRWNFAFMSAAGPFERAALPSFYYVTPPDPRWSRRERDGYLPGRADLLATTVHEVWPGHFLHSLHLKKVPSKILRSLCSEVMVEGWAHYAEEMMIEQGFAADDPAARIGMLLKALLRDVRFVAAIGLHAKGMTVAKATRLFEQQAWADKKTAAQQAARGTFDPGYFNYTLGKLMIRKLAADLAAKQGAAFSLAGFHDRLLSYGCAPLPAIRRAMLGDDSPPL